MMPPCLAEAALSKQPRPPGTGWHARDFVSRAWSAAEVMPAEDTPRIGNAGALHAHSSREHGTRQELAPRSGLEKARQRKSVRLESQTDKDPAKEKNPPGSALGAGAERVF